MEARLGNHLGEAEGLACHRNSPFPLGTATEVGKIPGNEVSVRLRTVVALSVGACMALSACGDSSISGRKDVVTFCGLAKQMEAASSTDAHGQDPAAITDPTKMEEAWTEIVSIAVKMSKASPPEVAEDVTTMVDSIVSMNSVFKKNSYDLLAMARKPKVRTELAKITSDKSVQDASSRYNSFMSKNCK